MGAALDNRRPKRVGAAHRYDAAALRLGGRRTATALIALLVLLSLSGGGPAGAQAATAAVPRTAPATGPATGPASTLAATTTAAKAPSPSSPIDFVILVDESGSLSDDDVVQEKAAATLLALGEFSDRSHASVVGFGSQSASGHSAVDDICPRTATDTAGRQALSQCISTGVKPRKDGEDDTDFVAAVKEGLSILRGGPSGVPKILFLLTDGQLNVGANTNYREPEGRNPRGTAELAGAVDDARRFGAQIWPLGFGKKAQVSELDKIAAGGAQGACPLSSARPSAHVVSDSKVVADALLQAFAGARCARRTPSSTAPSVTADTDLTVHIPAVATDASLTVVKGDPASVAVTYYDPRGKKVPTTGGGTAAYQLSGQSGPVEALHIANPLSGDWRVHIDVLGSPREGQRITAVGIWQGVLHSIIAVEPGTPVAGQPLTVRMTLQTRSETVLTPQDLAGIGVNARLTGTGFAPLTVRLFDDGEAAHGDRRAHDGEFAARPAVPAKATGTLFITGVMAGQGVAGDQRSYSAEVAKTSPTLTGSLFFDTRKVYPGQTAHGHVDLRNSGAADRTLVLRLTGADAAYGLTISPQTVSVAAGATPRVVFELRFGKGAPVGQPPGLLELRDERNGLVTSGHLTVEVRHRPSWLDQHAWPLGIGSALAAIVVIVLLLRLRDRRRARDLSGIRLLLFQGGAQVSALSTPARAGRSFSFQLSGSGAARRIVADGPGGHHRVSRAPDGGLVVRRPDGTRLSVPRGRQVPLTDDLLLAFAEPGGRDREGPQDRGPRAADGGPPRRPGARDAPGGRRDRRAGRGGDDPAGDARQSYDDAF